MAFDKERLQRRTDVLWETYSGEFKRLPESKTLRTYTTDPRVQADSERAHRVHRSKSLDHFMSFRFRHKGIAPTSAINVLKSHFQPGSGEPDIVYVRPSFATTLAKRPLQCPVSEISSVNLLHTKIRNILTPERVHKLLYIRHNRRTLRHNRKDEGFIAEEEHEEAIFDTAEAQGVSEGAEIISGDELWG